MAFPQNPFTVWAFVFDIHELVNGEQMPEAATKCAEWEEGTKPRTLPRSALNSNEDTALTLVHLLTRRRLRLDPLQIRVVHVWSDEQQ